MRSSNARTMSSVPDRTRLEVYVQSLAPNKNRQISTILKRIARLEAEGVIESFDVYVVGKELCPETALHTESGQYLCARLLQFRDWAEGENKEFGSFFRPQSVDSTLTGDEYETIPVPTVTVAEFVDGTLQFVTPCTDGETHHTPQSRLDQLSAPEQVDNPIQQSVEN